MDSSQIKNLRKALAAAFRIFRREYHRSLTDDEAEIVRSTILYPTACVIPTLKSKIHHEETCLVRMTETQKLIIDCLEHCKRLAIRGYAGTGKTPLALEKARRLYHEGLTVAVLCLNRALSEDMRMALIKYTDRVAVNHYHALCWRLCKEAGVPSNPAQDEDEERAIQFWRYETPLLLLDALKKVDTRYDGIIIDEGQDFEEAWFESLKHILADPENGYFYIFLDPSQTIYCEPGRLPVPLSDLVLRTNCRNTKSIAKLVRKFRDVEINPHPDAPDGEKPVFIWYEDQSDRLEKVEATIARPLREEGIEPLDVVYLSTHLHRFKGLEANIVHLCYVREGDERCKPERLYVAISRARHRIYIFHHKYWQPPLLDA